MVLQVKVKPRSRVAALQQLPDGTWVAQLRSPPVDGLANAELIALVAAHFGRPRSAVRIQSGHTSRWKRVQVDD
ncbi:MAG: DUF167 domain-containing protein [Thermoflexales bacterium]